MSIVVIRNTGTYVVHFEFSDMQGPSGGLRSTEAAVGSDL